jgi:hypothetical protein
LTIKHAADVCFEGRFEAAKKRIQKLRLANLIASRQRRVHEPNVMFLTGAGIRFLRATSSHCELLHLPKQPAGQRRPPSESILNHELQVLDVKAAFHAAARTNPSVAISEFSTWPPLHQFKALKGGRVRQIVSVRPDGFMRVRHEAGETTLEHAFFLELDRSTEIQESLALRLGSYLHYYRSGGFALRSGAPAVAYRQHPFRVLVVFKTAERRNNTAERLLQLNPPILTQAWLSTFEEVTTDPLGEIWVRPLDYQAAVKGTPFEPGGSRKKDRYRRQAQREDLVERIVKKSTVMRSRQEAIGSFCGQVALFNEFDECPVL